MVQIQFLQGRMVSEDLGRKSFSEVSLEVVKTEDDGLGRKFPILSVESLERGEERRRAKRSCGSRSLYGYICNRMDERFEGGLESNTPRKCTRLSPVPLKSSLRVLLGIAGSIKTSRVEAGS